jgi:DNA polymerase I
MSSSQMHLGHKPIQFGEVAGTGKSFIGFARVAIDKATEVLRRRRRRDAAPVGSAQTPPRSGRHDARLRNAGATAHRCSCTHGAARHLHRPADSLAALGRVRARHGASGGRHSGRSWASPSIPARQSSWATFSSARWACPGARKPRPAPGQPPASVLEEPAEQGHDLPARILEWRSLQKLKSTYTDALPGFVNKRTGRVHTSFSLAATTTGRLSSSEPNLQNIPIRNRGGPQDPDGLRRDAGPQADFRRLLADRAAHSWRISRTFRS